MTKLYDKPEFREQPIDLLVGGTPCQSFSIAGLRKGLDDPRGNLALEFLRLADIAKPRWIVWENVPGVLSSHNGRDFGSFVGALQKLGYGFAYRILDAQYFGVPQRRRRVFVIGYLGDWRPAAAVLFESQSLCGNIETSRKKRKKVARCLRSRANASHREDSDTYITTYDFQSSGEYGTNPVASAVAARDYKSAKELVVIEQNNVSSTPDLPSCRAHTMPNYAVFDPNQITSKTNRSIPHEELSHTLPATANSPIAFQSSQSGVRLVDTHATLDSHNGSRRHNGVLSSSQIRRLTPRECERLQGFPDDYTLIPFGKKLTADGHRYKAIGNSMAVPVMHWIGRRIHFVDNFLEFGF